MKYFAAAAVLLSLVGVKADVGVRGSKDVGEDSIFLPVGTKVRWNDLSWDSCMNDHTQLYLSLLHCSTRSSPRRSSAC
jgi:hypothetical protein